MKTTTKTVQLPIQVADIHTYEVDGRAYVSMSELARSTRNHKSTVPVQKWLSDAATNPSDANGSQGPQALEGATPFEAVVPVDSGRTTSIAKLFSPSVAWHFILSELTNRSSTVRDRAIRLIQIVGAAGFETMCQEALGLRVSVEENLTAAVRLQADLDQKAPDIQRLKLAVYKAMLPHVGFASTHDLPKDDRRYPIWREIKLVVNSLYARLDEGVHAAISTVQKNTPHSKWKRPTKYSCLTEEARTALKPVINAYITAFSMLEHQATALDVKRIIEKIDRIYPRYC